MGEAERGEAAPRQAVTYFCSHEHRSVVTFAVDAVVPESWDCPKCGLPASLDSENPPPAPKIEPYKTHLAYVKERRSDAEAANILDDGARPALRALAEAEGIGVVTRSSAWTADVPRHAKAGNLNNALMVTEGEFLLILDADQVPEPEILELDEPVVEDMRLPEVDLGPPLVSDDAAEASRSRLAALQEAAAAAPPPPAVNPLEQMVRDMLRPMLKDWLDQNLPGIVDEHVKREIGRITGQGL